MFVDVTIAPDYPTGRDFLSLLSLTLAVEDFAGLEKISYLPRSLDTAGSPGSRPVAGDLSYYVPRGNLVFYYDTEGIGYSEQTIRLGSYSATAEQLARLEGSAVTVEVVDQRRIPRAISPRRNPYPPMRRARSVSRSSRTSGCWRGQVEHFTPCGPL